MSKEYVKLCGELSKPAFDHTQIPTVFNWESVSIPRSDDTGHDKYLHRKVDQYGPSISKYGCSAQCHDYCTPSKCKVPVENTWPCEGHVNCPVLQWRQVAFARELISNGLTSMAATSPDWDIEDEEYHGACYRPGWFSRDCAWENDGRL